MSNIWTALGRYRTDSVAMRLFTLARHLLAPLEKVAEHVPPSGRILDLGCGHGLFTNLLALGSPDRQLTGVDPSADKIAVAKRSSAGLPNVRYFQGRIEDITDGPYDVIAINDVLYLLPDADKVNVLRRCHSLLKPDGLLLLKTNDTRPRWRYSIVLLEEELMVRVLSLTYGGQIHFRGIPEYLALLKQAGFEARAMKIDSWRPAPHRLFVCRPVALPVEESPSAPGPA